MELKLIDAKGQAASTMAASDALFANRWLEPVACWSWPTSTRKRHAPPQVCCPDNKT